MAGKLAYKAAELALAASLAGRYVALLTAAPSGPAATLASLAEYSATGYTRQAVTFGTATGTPRVAANTNTITTSALTGATGLVTLTHWALVSSASGTSGDLIAYGDLAGADRSPEAGQAVTLAVGALTVSLD